MVSITHAHPLSLTRTPEPTHNQTLSNIPLYPFVTNTFLWFFEPSTLTLHSSTGVCMYDSSTRVCKYAMLLSMHSSSIVDHAFYVAVCVICKVQLLMNAIVSWLHIW